MKQILIISELFYPQNAIGAIRPTKIREWLIKKGYTVDVITKSYSENPDELVNGKIWRIKATQMSETSKPNTMTSSNSNRLILELKRARRTFLSIKSSVRYRKSVIEFIKNNIDISAYNAVLTTFGPISSVMIGRKIKKTYPSKKWICDFRDPMVVEEVSVFMKPVMRFLQSKACKEADHIVAVSNGYLSRICGNKYVSKRHMIPNGYDTDDIAVLENCTQPTNIIHVAYVGTLYEGKRKITPLFHVLRELADSGKIDLSKICFDYAGRDGAFLCSQAEEFCLSSIIRDHGVLSRTECLKLQFSSHLLVLSTWNNKNEYGVFPGKFLEYMLIGKPIISVVDGNLPNSEVSEVIEEGNLGIAYEAARDNEDYIKLKKYIEKQYLLFVSGQEIEFRPQEEVIERYNYKNIIKQIEEVING